MAVLGSITLNEIMLMEIDEDPRINGVDVATGSLAFMTDGSAFYQKLDGDALTWSDPLEFQMQQITEMMGEMQPLSELLEAIAALSTNGIISKTGTNTASTRSIEGSSPITVSNGDGVSGNPSISHANSAVSAGTYGSSTQIPQFTVDARGHLTNASNQTLNIGHTYLSSTTVVSRTANTFTTINGMTTTPAAGTYLCIYSGEARMSNLNGLGEISFFVAGTQQSATTRAIEIEVALLLGLIGSSIVETGASISVGIFTVNGSQTIDVRYRSVDGQTISIGNRTLALIKVA